MSARQRPTDPERKPGRPKDPALEARRRDEILTAAALVFAEVGYAVADVQLIADKLGIGKGTIYRYYPTKRELFLATVDRGLDELSARIDAVVLDPVGDPVAQFQETIRTYLRFFHERPEMVELFIQERAAFRDRHTPRYFVVSTEEHNKHAAFIDRLLATGQIRPMSLEQFCTVIGDALYGTVVSNQLSGRPAEPEAQASVLIDVLLHGLYTDTGRRAAARATRKARK